VSWALGASALLHLALVSALSEVDGAAALRPRRAPEVSEEVAFEPLLQGPTSGEQAQRTAPPAIIPGGLAPTGTLDRNEPEGRGGELQALEKGSLLFSFVSPMTLQDTELNNLAANQVQRIRTAPQRASLENRRATPSAQDAVLLASGRIGHAERREPSRSDAVEGARLGSLASAPSAALAAVALNTGADPQSPQQARPDRRLRPAQGILRGRGERERPSARVTFARPNVDRAAAATPAVQLDSRVRDDADSELLAAKLQRSFVDTSVQRTQQVGAGSGGVVLDPRALGESGQGTGARARPYSPGLGNFSALDTSDARYLHWFTQQRARVQQGLEFPKARALAKDQGTSLYRVVLARDGALSGTPRLVRSSGYADFDRAAARAIERALPFAPLPRELAPELDSIALLIPVAFANPMVE